MQGQNQEEFLFLFFSFSFFCGGGGAVQLNPPQIFLIFFPYEIYKSFFCLVKEKKMSNFTSKTIMHNSEGPSQTLDRKSKPETPANIYFLYYLIRNS